MPGAHVITAELDIGDINADVNLTIQGFGDVSIIKTVGDIDATDVNNCASIIFKDFKLDCSSMTTAGRPGLDINAANDGKIIVENVTIYDDGGICDGVEINSENVIVRNCHISGVRYGIFGTTAHKAKCYENIIYDCASGGIFMDQTDKFTLTDNNIDGNGEVSDYGIRVRDCQDISCVDNFVDDCISGVYIEGQSDHGTYISNTVINCSGRGIDVVVGDYNSITANVIHDCGDGIQLGAAASNNYITVNMLENNTLDIDDNSDGTNYISNDLRDDLVFKCRTEANITAALAEIGAGSGVIQIIGTIPLTGTITVDGGGSYVIQGYGNVSVLDCNGDRTALHIDDAASCVVKDLEFDGSDMVGPSRTIIQSTTDNVIFENLNIYGRAADKSDADGINMYSNFNEVRNCKFQYCEYGVHITQGATGGKIEGNYFNDCTFGVWMATTVDRLSIKDNKYTDCTVGIGTWDECDYITIEGNLFTDGAEGVRMTNGNHCIVNDNICYSQSTAGIKITTSDYNHFGGNIFQDTPKGIHIVSGTGNAIGINTYSNCTASYTDAGTGTTFTGDNLGNHSATANLDMNDNDIIDLGTGITFRADGRIATTGANNLYMKTDGTDRWYFRSNGHLYPSVANTYDIGSGTNEVGEVFHCGLTAGTCADFSKFGLDELINIITFEPDETFYEKMKSGEYLPHINMDTVHPLLSGILDLKDELDKDQKIMTKKTLSGLYEKIDDRYIPKDKINVEGDKVHIDFENLVYAQNETIKKSYLLIKELQIRITELEK